MTKDRYAFYASLYLDKENEISLTKQFGFCYRQLDEKDGEFIGYYSDKREIASPNRRSGLMNLLRDAKAGKFEYVLVNDINRLGLNRDNLLEVVRRLKVLSVEVYCCLGQKQPLSVQLAEEIHAAEQEKAFQAAMAWERYWDEQMEVAEQDYRQAPVSAPLGQSQDLNL